MVPTLPGTVSTFRRRAGLLLGAAALVLLGLASLAVGSRQIPLTETFAALTAYDPGNDLHLIVMQLRVPRTILAGLVGAALGLAGAVMQAMTRNPLAEPGLLGINAGAAVAVVAGVAIFGFVDIAQYVWLAFAGAGLASGAVYLLGRAGDVDANPVRLVLAGAGLTIVLVALTNVILLNSPDTVYNDFRNWATGSLQGRGYTVIPIVMLAGLLGAGLAGTAAASLNAIALGADLGKALGVRMRTTWIAASASVLLLAGAATAAAGPIAFVGLVAPHVARLAVGPDLRRILPASALFAAILLLAADVLGRLVAPPSEIGAGVMSALIGGPFFVLLVRRRRMARP